MTILKVPVTQADHQLGPHSAPITLVEYGDYQCPHCARAEPVVRAVREHYGDELRFVFRNFPLTRIHPWAEPAAEIAEFAGADGKFWQMHDLLFESQERLGDALFVELSEVLALSMFAMRDALKAGVYRPRVREDFEGGVRSGVNGTPTFFINGQRYDGPNDLVDLLAVIDRVPARLE